MAESTTDRAEVRAMKRLCLILCVLIACISIGRPTTTQAAGASLTNLMPRSDFPAKMRSLVANPLENLDWDCLIAYDCQYGAVLVHSAFGEELHRTTGWVILTSSHSTHEQFVDTLNIFEDGQNKDGVQYNRAALEDEAATMPTWGKDAHEAHFTLPTLPDGAETLTWDLRPDKDAMGILFVSVAWGQTEEAELLAPYTKPYRKDALTRILHQLRDILSAPVPTDP